MSLNFRKQQQQEPVYAEADNEEDQQQQLVKSELAGDIDLQQHLTKDMFTKAQDVILDFDLVASPSEVANGLVSLEWRLADFLTSHFKQNLAQSDRHLAGVEHLAGNLNRCAPLHLQILQQQNTFPFAMGINIPGMMPITLHQKGKCLWRVPAGTQTMMVNQPAFEPQNRINQYMYANYRMCTVEDLNTDLVRVEKKKSDKVARYDVTVGSFAYNELLNNLDRGMWEDQFDQIELSHIDNPGRSPTVSITEKMGSELHKMISGPVEEVARSFINLEELSAQFVRADGVNGFASPKNIAGEIVGSDKVSGTKLNTDVLQIRSTFHVKALFTYILF